MARSRRPQRQSRETVIEANEKIHQFIAKLFLSKPVLNLSEYKSILADFGTHSNFSTEVIDGYLSEEGFDKIILKKNKELTELFGLRITKTQYDGEIYWVLVNIESKDAKSFTGYSSWQNNLFSFLIDLFRNEDKDALPVEALIQKCAKMFLEVSNPPTKSQMKSFLDTLSADYWVKFTNSSKTEIQLGIRALTELSEILENYE